MPFLGICLGMQIAVIEFARSVLGLSDANSTEFDPETSNPCVIFMPEVCKFTGALIKFMLTFVSSFYLLKCFLCLSFSWIGFKNSHGRNYASGVKEDKFDGYRLQICKVVRTRAYKYVLLNTSDSL